MPELHMFLDRDELKGLTGYTRASAQMRWLREQGIPYLVNAIGMPVVATEEIQRKLVRGDRNTQSRSEPNWGALNAPRVRFDELRKPRQQRSKTPRVVVGTLRRARAETQRGRP